LVKIL